jgi:hypothetical protein
MTASCASLANITNRRAAIFLSAKLHPQAEIEVKSYGVAPAATIIKAAIDCEYAQAAPVVGELREAVNVSFGPIPLKKAAVVPSRTTAGSRRVGLVGFTRALVRASESVSPSCEDSELLQQG